MVSPPSRSYQLRSRRRNCHCSDSRAENETATIGPLMQENSASLSWRQAGFCHAGRCPACPTSPHLIWRVVTSACFPPFKGISEEWLLFCPRRIVSWISIRPYLRFAGSPLPSSLQLLPSLLSLRSRCAFCKCQSPIVVSVHYLPAPTGLVLANVAATMSGHTTVTSAYTLTDLASALILPHDTASSGRAPASDPSNSCPVLM